MKNKENKIIITGTGRAGTTFLIRLFTELDFDTGFKKGDDSNIFKNCNAGMESNELKHYITKNPKFFSENILQINKKYNLDMVYIPLRSIEEAAKSRAKIGFKPGGFIGASNIEDQIKVLKIRLGNLIADLVLNDIPYTFLVFPKFLKDPKYTYDKLMPFVKKIPYDHFKEVFIELSGKTKSDFYKK